MRNDSPRIYKSTVIICILISCSFAAGNYIGKSSLPSGAVAYEALSGSTSSTVSLDTFWKVWNTLDQKFVPTTKESKKANTDEKIWGAIGGLTSAYGDPYTIFMPPEEAKAFDSDIRGNFEGVGMELGMREKNLVVVAPLPDTPAYRAGVKKGDVLLSIDGETTAGMSIDTAVKKIRGKAGTSVVIEFARDGVKEPVKITITRGVINAPTLSTEIKDDVFIIKLHMFNALAPEKFRDGLREFVASGKHKLIVDLRGNPGGYLDAAVDMTSWFLPMGKIVVRENFGTEGKETIYRSKGYNVFASGLNMAILVDEGSASASEIFAGALKEQGIAKLVGAKTFGKGSVQELVRITPETSLKVTVAKWLTPNGISISDGGLTPDIEVPFTRDDAEKGKDPQLEKAIEVLQ